MTIRIEPSSEDLVPSFREWLDVVAREKRYLALLEAPPLEAVRGFVAANLANGAVQFFAVDGTRVVGWADVSPYGMPTLKHRGNLGIGLLPEYRGRGIGRKLLDACVAAAHAKGMSRIELEVRLDNANAIKLYEDAGFEHECVKRGAIRFDGVPYDVSVMSHVSEP